MRMYTGDLKPDLQVTCSADEPVDLDDAVSVRIIGRRDDTIVFDSTPDTQTVVGDTTVVTRLWQAGDTAETGLIQIEVEATWPGNKKQTFRANGGVDIHRDFDAAALEAADPPPLETVVSDASISAVLVVEDSATRAIVQAMVEDEVASHTPGSTLQSAKYTSAQAIVSATGPGASALITGLTVVVTGTGRAVDIDFIAQSARHASVAGAPVYGYLEVNGSITDPRCNSAIGGSPSITVGRALQVRSLDVVLDDGVVYTIKAGFYGPDAGNKIITAAAHAAATLAVTAR